MIPARRAGSALRRSGPFWVITIAGCGTSALAGEAGLAERGAPASVRPGQCEVEVPLVLDTDLFSVAAVPGAPASPETPADPGPPTGPHFVLREVYAPLGFHPERDPDGLAMRDAVVPLPRALPDGACQWRSIGLLTAAQGPIGAKGIAAEGTLLYDDGTRQPLKWMVGEQAWPGWAGATGRGATAVPLGVNVAGDTITASWLQVPLVPPNPGALPVSLHLKARGGLDLVLLRASLSLTPVDSGPATAYTSANLTPFSWPEWFTHSLLPGMPPEPGPVRIIDGNLTFANGGPARFWGVNLVGNGALPPVNDARPFATHLASLGFNLVRLHHIDTDSTLANPARPVGPLTNPEALDRLDRFSAALNEAGVFQYVELVTQHHFRVSDGVNKPADVPGGHKWVANFEDDWELAEQQWAMAVWGRTNPYTGLRYADDPHVAMIELENENSLVVAWSGGALERLPAPHIDQLDALWNAWLAKKYSSDAAIARAWSGSTHPGLGHTELLAAGSVRRDPTQRARTDQWPIQRTIDLVQFYSELELRHQARMTTFVRERLGFKGPLICNTAFGIPQADVLLEKCDVIDLHMYWDGIAETNVFADTSLLRDPWAGRFLERFGSCQTGKPCTVSEVQHTAPNRHAQEAPLLWASLASRQGISAVTWFAWSHDTPRHNPDGAVGTLDLEGRWGALMQMPGAAWLFRSGAIPAAEATFERWWSEDGLRRDLAEQPGLWLSELVDPSSLMRQRVRSAFGPGPAPAGAPPGTLEALAQAHGAPGGVRWSPSASGASLLIHRPGFSAVVGGTGSAAGLTVFAHGSADPAVSLQWVESAPGAAATAAPGKGATGRLVVAGPTIRAGTLFREDGYGTVVSGLGPSGLAPLRVHVMIVWPSRPVLTALPGTVGTPPEFQPAPQHRSRGVAGATTEWMVEILHAGWWTVR